MAEAPARHLATPPTSPLSPGSADTLTATSYDNAGNLLTEVNGRGQTTTYTYNDPDGLLSNVSYPTVPTSLTVGRDGFGRVNNLTDGAGTLLGYSYDDNDAITSTSTQYAQWSAAIRGTAADAGAEKRASTTITIAASLIDAPRGRSFSWNNGLRTFARAVSWRPSRGSTACRPPG